MYKILQRIFFEGKALVRILFVEIYILKLLFNKLMSINKFEKLHLFTFETDFLYFLQFMLVTRNFEDV